MQGELILSKLKIDFISYLCDGCHQLPKKGEIEGPSLVLVINDTKLIMSCVKCFELGISNTCDKGVCGEEWWPQDHKEILHGHEIKTMKECT
jgi:hypothetical protein